ncbi:MAG: hypothetical protein SOW89_02450 [Eubacteriales bacterium]|nr:hypothetical protein [Eubacteriales bacterium]
MGIFSKIKSFFTNSTQEKKFVMPSYWTQEELNNYFKEGLNTLYKFVISHSPNSGMGDNFLLIVQIYQSLILENEFNLKKVNSYDSQEIRTIGLLYGLDLVYNKEESLNYIQNSNINKELVKNTMSSNRLENALAKDSRYIAEFIIAYTLNKKETLQDMVNNPLIDKFFNRYLVDNGIINMNDDIGIIGSQMEEYAYKINYSLNYLYLKTKDINYLPYNKTDF